MNIMKVKTFFVLAVLTAGVAITHAAEILPYPEAKEKAKTEKKMLIVVTDGSDWLPTSALLNKTYKAVLAKAGAKSDEFVWALHDEKDVKLNDEGRRQLRPPVKVWNYPAIQVLDDESRPLYFKERLAPEELNSLGTVLGQVQELKKKRDSFWKKADESKGVDITENLAKGLMLLPEKLARHDAYKPLIERMKKADTEDKKGYVFRFTYQFLPFIEKEVNKRVEAKQYKEAYAVIDSKLKLPALTKEQKQCLMAAKFRVARAEGNLKEGLHYLKQLVDIDPGSEMAQGARGMTVFYTQPVKLPEMRWVNTDNRPVWLPMVCDVSSAIKGSGKYKIEFKHRGGHTKFRNPAFKTSAGRVLASIKDDKERREFFLDIGSGGKVILEVESQGTGWFDGRGDIIVTKQ